MSAEREPKALEAAEIRASTSKMVLEYRGYYNNYYYHYYYQIGFNHESMSLAKTSRYMYIYTINHNQ